MFSQTSEYALRAVVWLATEAEGPVGVQWIAEGTQVPESYLSKVLQQLSQAGLVISRRGVGGGHELSRPPNEITILEVINCVDPIKRITSCPLSLKSHSKKRCGMHSKLDEALQNIEAIFSQSTIDDVVNNPNCPPPLKEVRRGSRQRRN